MSIIIKSNNASTKNLGTLKMVGTTPLTEFNNYKARVMADGGIVKSESATLAAFKFLFDTKLYGNMNTAVAGKFGVKTNVSGGIEKLYAIDGDDMLGVVYGSGTLPTLTVSNDISFAANTAGVGENGGMFTTAQKRVLSKTGDFGYGLHAKNSSSTISTVADITVHSDAIYSLPVAQISTNTSLVVWQVATTSVSKTISLGNKDWGYPPVSLLASKSDSKLYGYRSESAVTNTDAIITDVLLERDFYIDFGGAYRTIDKVFAAIDVGHFMCFNQATKEQAVALSVFSL